MRSVVGIAGVVFVVVAALACRSGTSAVSGAGTARATGTATAAGTAAGTGTGTATATATATGTDTGAGTATATGTGTGTGTAAATATAAGTATGKGTGAGSAKAQLSGSALYDSLLRRYCRAGRVAYSRMARQSKAEIERVVRWLGSARPPSSRDGKLAFYLDAYNALVIAAVVRRSPGFRGVMTVPGFFKRARHRVAGRQVTLDQLENRIIRPTFKDPRVHFALVCGAASCPPLRCRAFAVGSLDAVLEGLTRRFINSARGLRLAAAPNAAPRVSALFKWYADDFKRASGSPARYIARYHRQAAKRLETVARLDYLPYSWVLNGK